MKLKTWLLMGFVFLASSSVWAVYVVSRRAYLRDFNGGVHAYLAGDFTEAEQTLRKALGRRPRNAQAQQLLLKVLIEQSFSQYHRKDYAGALGTLKRASEIAPADDQAQQALDALRTQLAELPEKRPVEMEQMLGQIYRHLPEHEQPSSLQSMMEQWLRRSAATQETILKRFWDNQEHWLVQLQQEKEEFRKLFYSGLALFGAGGLALLVLLFGVLHAYFGRRGIFSRLLEEHYQRLLVALPAGTQALLGPPLSLNQVPESRQMDSIEAEIVDGAGTADSQRQLQTLLEGGNPWVRARAAKILHRIDPAAALEELTALINDPSGGVQVSGLWALAELATPQAVELLAPLAYSPLKETQQGAVRSLLQLQTKMALPSETRQRIGELLSEIRSRTGWIF